MKQCDDARIPAFIRGRYEIYEWKHAVAILSGDFASEWQDILDLLTEFKLRKAWIEKGGGNKSQVSDFIDGFLGSRGWCEKGFATAIQIDDALIESPTHKVDCYKRSYRPGNRMKQQRHILRSRLE